MREILFRGKRVDSGEWVYGLLTELTVTLNREIAKIRRQEAVWGIEVDPATLGQYTGLTDKNGKKIFEGDIIKANCGHIGYVEFVQGAFVKACKCHNHFTELYGDNSEVIGNKFDNPELLGGEADV